MEVIRVEYDEEEAAEAERKQLATTRAQVRQALDEAEERIRGTLPGPELSREQWELVSGIIQAVYAEPSLPPMALMSDLEQLLTDPELGTRSVYDLLDERRAAFTNQVAARAFLAGMKAGREEAAAAPMAEANPAAPAGSPADDDPDDD